MNWSCVVERNQTYRNPDGQTLEVASVRNSEGMADATVYLAAVDASGNRKRNVPPVDIAASRLCAGDSGWTRLPDEDEATTMWEPPPTPTRVGLGPKLPARAS